MGLADDTAYVGQLLDAYAVDAGKVGVVAEDPEDEGVPPEMQAGEVDDDGWVAWRMLPSTLTEADVAAIEREFNVQFPPLFRAYLLARFHLFDQARSRRHDQQILMTHTPADRPLAPLRDLLEAWQPLADTGFIPLAEWGDGWGPMCFDSRQPAADGDCPVVWFDHEQLDSPDPPSWRYESLRRLAQPLYASCREFLADVFGT